MYADFPLPPSGGLPTQWGGDPLREYYETLQRCTWFDSTTPEEVAKPWEELSVADLSPIDRAIFEEALGLPLARPCN